MDARDGGGPGVGSWIARRARITPDRPALIAGERAITYADLAGRIRRLASGLSGLGVEPGDRIAWIGANHPAFLETFFAAATLGAVLAPVNHRLAVGVRRGILDDVEPVVLIEHAMDEDTPVPSSVRQRVRVGGDATHAADDRLDYESLLRDGLDAPPAVVITPDDLLFLPHTSGTTGRPKQVMLSHGNVTWNVINVQSCIDIRADDITIAVAPFFRVGGTGVNVLPVLFRGGTVVLPTDATPDVILETIERHRVTVGFANPDLLDRLVASERWATSDLSSIRFIVTGGAPVPERTIRTFLDRRVPLLQGFGMSEAAPVVMVLDPEIATRKIGAAGRPAMFVDVRIVDPAGADVAIGDTGELLVHGPNVMLGYWRHPAETAETIAPGGWLRTGDAARMDEDGDITIVDRADARFEIGGRTVYPGDIERVLATHRSVAEVAVLPITTTGGVGVAAVVVPRDRPNDLEASLVAFARARLTSDVVPASVTVVDGLPRNSVGKLIRANLPGMVEPRPPSDA